MNKQWTWHRLFGIRSPPHATHTVAYQHNAKFGKTLSHQSWPTYLTSSPNRSVPSSTRSHDTLNMLSRHIITTFSSAGLDKFSDRKLLL